MEVRKPVHFIISTSILVAVMIAIVFTFSMHPMGADFTQFFELNEQDIHNLKNLEGLRIAIRGIVTADEADKMLTVQEENAILGYIRINTAVSSKFYEDFKTVKFSLFVNEQRIPVRGQPEQIVNSEDHLSAGGEETDTGKKNDVIYDDKDSDVIYQVIREGGEYSIFGTLKKNQAGRIILVPYRVTSTPITTVKNQADQINRKMNSTQYLMIFSILTLFILFLWKAEVLVRTHEK
jgi:hypothetical protein